MAERRQVLIDLITRTTGATAGIARTQGQLTGLQKSAVGARSGLLGVSGGAALAAAGVGVAALAVRGGVKAFAGFDDAMNQSLSIMGNVSDGMRKEMADAAREMAKATRFSAEEAAESYFFLASAGLDAEQSIAALPQVAAFAQAGMFDMARATDLLTDAQSALGLTIRDDTVKNMENMARVSDVLVKANTLANASVQQFSEALTNRAGAALRLVNKDVEEGVAVLAAMADQGVKGAEAGTRLDIVLRDLQRRAIDNRQEFARLGISVFDNAGNMRNMADIVGDLEGALDGMSDEQRRATLLQLGFQDRSVAALLTLVGLSDQIREYEAGLRQAGGTTKEVADNQLQSFSAQMDLVKSRLTDVGIELGEKVAPGVLAAAQGFVSLVEALSPAIGLLATLIGMPLGAFFDLVGRGLTAIDALFGDEAAQGAIRFREAIDNVTETVERGGDGAVAYANSLVHLAREGALTADRVRQLGSDVEFVGEQQAEALRRTLEWSEANGVAADQIELLEDALVAAIFATERSAEEQEALIEAYGLTEAAARGVAEGADDLADALDDAGDAADDHTEAMTGLEMALRDAEIAQESLSAAMRAFIDPVFGAVRSLEKLEAAQAEVSRLQEEGKEDTDEFAKAQLELAAAVLEAQGSLDAFSAKGVEDQIRVIAEALGITEGAARELLERLGLLDGKRVSMVFESQFTTRGSPPPGVSSFGSVAGTFVGLQHGGHARAGVPHLVGEAGRELFIPDVPGTVVPHGDTERLIAAMADLVGGGRQVTNNWSIPVQSSGNSQIDAQKVGAIASVLRRIETR